MKHKVYKRRRNRADRACRRQIQAIKQGRPDAVKNRLTEKAAWALDLYIDRVSDEEWQRAALIGLNKSQRSRQR